MYIIEREIDILNEAERRLNMELLDVMTEVETPATSEDEAPEAPIVYPPKTGHIHQLFLNMLAVVAALSRDTEYSELYSDRKYLQKVNKKLKKMKKNARKIDFEKAYKHVGFVTHLNQILETYPDNGGRTFLSYLVALECHLKTKYDTESETDESEPEMESKKFNHFDNDNDHDENPNYQPIAV